MSKDKKKKKKDKVTYVDDGRTLYDMSAVGGGRGGMQIGNGTFKEQLKTYVRAVRRMIVPMLVTMAAICVVFGLLWLMLTLAE